MRQSEISVREAIRASQGSKSVISLKSMLEQVSHPVRLIPMTFKDRRSEKEVDGYSGVYDEALGRVVSVVTKDYTLLPNSSVVEPVLRVLEKMRLKFTVDRLTSISDRRMSLQLTFPEMTIKDDTKEGIRPSLFVSNSYDTKESFRLMVGAMRLVCTNGMMMRCTLSSYKMTHQAERIEAFARESITGAMRELRDNQKRIEMRIIALCRTRATMMTVKLIAERFDNRSVAYLLRELRVMSDEDTNRKAAEYVRDSDPLQKLVQSEWKVYNTMTEYVTHAALTRYRLYFLSILSKIFDL